MFCIHLVKKVIKMKEFYYEIKCQKQDSLGSWAFPPMYSGLLKAKDKKAARKALEDEFDVELPCRVLKKDFEKSPYLLKLREHDGTDEYLNRLFENRKCKECSNSFRRIDLYNDHNEQYKGIEFCSRECQQKYGKKHIAFNASCIDKTHGNAPVIYKITNTAENKHYIGKTLQVFTLRWYQHFFQGGDCKFHKAIRNTKLTDWEFSVLEIIGESPEGMPIEEYVLSRETHWMKKYDSIDNGYNSQVSSITVHGHLEEG